MTDTPGWIAEIEFPAMKVELIEAAVASDAPQDEVEQLQQLSCEQYERWQDVEAELAA